MSSDKLLDSSDGTVVVADWKAINLEGKLARAIHVNQIHLRCAQRDVVTKIFVNQVNDQIQVCRHGTTGDDIAFINNHGARWGRAVSDASNECLVDYGNSTRRKRIPKNAILSRNEAFRHSTPQRSPGRHYFDRAIHLA